MRPPPAAQRADGAGAVRPGGAREAAEAHLNAGIRAAFASEVAHHLPGRVRLRVPQLKADAALVGLARTLAGRAGILSVRAAPACASLIVEYDPALVSVARVRAWLGEAVAPPRSSEVAPPERVDDRGDLVALLCGAGALALSAAGAPGALTAGLLALSTVPVVGRALRSLVSERRLSVDGLDTIAIGVLAAQGDRLAASLSAALIAGGECIRALTARRSRRALAGMLAARGRFVWVVRGRRKVRLPAERVTAGDTVIIYPGEQVLVDGEVIRGRALVDQKALTGESVPVLKRPGERVFASTVLTDGKLYVRTEQIGTATRAGQIVQILEGAPIHDTRIGNYARRWADRFVLPTLLLAGGLWWATGDLVRAAAVVVFDFATGIRVSVPTAVLATMSAGARRALLIKGGRALEQLARMDTLVFDKTGTLTAGTPQVVDVRALAPEVGANDVLALAAAVEQRLSHPAAQAIVRAAEERGVAIPERRDSHFTVGMGVEADVQGYRVLLGSPRYLARKGVAVSQAAATITEEAGQAGASTSLLACDGRLIGAVCYRDVVRPEAREALARLRERGIRRLVMVTGDNQRAAAAVAREVGIDEVAAEVFPERKATIVQELQRAGHVVGVIGDGINDSPALAYADVSFSLEAGTDVAREAADVVLHGDLHGLVEARDLACACLRLIRQSLGLVAAPNGLGLLLAAAGLVGPVAATALNNGSAVAAALNSLRPLLPARPPLAQRGVEAPGGAPTCAAHQGA